MFSALIKIKKILFKKLRDLNIVYIKLMLDNKMKKKIKRTFKYLKFE